MLDSMTFAAFMCNSDKYSLYFSMMQLPKEARKMMMNQFDSQATEMIQQNKEELISKRGKQDTIIGQYIQDLISFLQAISGPSGFTDIFTMPLDFHNLAILRPYISDKESLTTIAEYYLRKNYFNDALTIFDQLAETDQDSDILFQKIGYCKQMEGDLKGALEAYLHADLLNSESKWDNPTNRRLLPFTKTTGRGLEILPPVRGFKSGQFVGSNQHRPLPPRTKRL